MQASIRHRARPGISSRLIARTSTPRRLGCRLATADRAALGLLCALTPSGDASNSEWLSYDHPSRCGGDCATEVEQSAGNSTCMHRCHCKCNSAGIWASIRRPHHGIDRRRKRAQRFSSWERNNRWEGPGFCRQGSASLRSLFRRGGNAAGTALIARMVEAREGAIPRPAVPILVLHGDGVALRDLNAVDSPNWGVKLIWSKPISVSGLDVRNNIPIPNNEAFDVSTSRDGFKGEAANASIPAPRRRHLSRMEGNRCWDRRGCSGNLHSIQHNALRLWEMHGRSWPSVQSPVPNTPVRPPPSAPAETCVIATTQA